MKPALFTALSLTLLGGGLLLSPLAQAAELVVPEAFDVLQVNDAPFGASLQREKRLTLAPGRHVIVLEYDQIFDGDFGDSHDRIRSKPFALVLTVTNEAVLTVQNPNLTNGTEARRYAKAPTLRVFDAANRELPIQVQSVQSVGEGFVTPTTAATPAPATLATPTPTAIPATPVTASAPAPATAEKSTSPASTDPLQQLQYWWQQATPEQRAAFLQQIVR
ncbi:MAG TPA: DUF2057 family protein [Permianibacter sp.]|nr:DUF2057 family protein [Permianibacter sp.]